MKGLKPFSSLTAGQQDQQCKHRVLSCTKQKRRSLKHEKAGRQVVKSFLMETQDIWICRTHLGPYDLLGPFGHSGLFLTTNIICNFWTFLVICTLWAFLTLCTFWTNHIKTIVLHVLLYSCCQSVDVSHGIFHKIAI